MADQDNSLPADFQALRSRAKGGSLDDLKGFVDAAKHNGFSGPELQKAKTELTRQVARADLTKALSGNSYRMIQKKLKRAQHWLSKSEIEDAQKVIKFHQCSRQLESVKNSRDTHAMRKACKNVEKQLSASNFGVNRKLFDDILKKADQIDELTHLTEANTGNDAVQIQQEIALHLHQTPTPDPTLHLPLPSSGMRSVPSHGVHGIQL